MTKVVNARRGWLATAVAALALGAFPAMAAAQIDQTNVSVQNQSGGGSQATNQANAVAGRDANISQTINQGAGVTGVRARRAGFVHRGRVAVHPRRVFFVRRVGLARTGFEAWMPIGIGALSFAGGLGLLMARRRASA